VTKLPRLTARPGPIASEFVDSPQSNNLPGHVHEVLVSFVESARAAFGDELKSVVLFGSGAEGKLRPSSDVNVLVLLAAFDRSKADRLREELRRAYAAIRLTAMFLLETELSAAIDAFAVKFGDITRRHRILHGVDPFVEITIPRAAAIARLKQTTLNLTLRMREIYIARSLREEQIALAIADFAGPLRASAATLLEIKGGTVVSPKEALEKIAANLLPGGASAELMGRITEARTELALAPGMAGATFFAMIDLAHRLWAEAKAL